tara:strand:+ start:8297 stop:9442 length:1146 start_codon:yes stop_codon:yes gene_type:complete
MSKKIKIALITERRADYSRFKPLLEIVKKDKQLEYNLIVTGLHLLDNHGKTINEIKKDGFKISHKLKMFYNSYKGDGASMVESMGNILNEIPKVLTNIKPDLILAGFDIGANFAIVVTGAHLNIPIAHIQGGELSGSIDESLRHSMSKFSNFHFVSNDDSKKRLIKMGENKKNIFVVGCPSIDALKNAKDINTKLLNKKFGLKFDDKFACMLQHPVTTENKSSEFQISQTLKALKLSKIPTFIILPNNDSGYVEIIKKIKLSNYKWTSTLSIDEYKTILKKCTFVIGNSSSGIHEAATYKKPVINIGTRQNKRLKSFNILNADYNYRDIKKKIDICLYNKLFLKKIQNVKNPYGDGKSAKKIIKIIKKLNLKLNTQKVNTY